jgi:hypothetical protein
MDFQRLEQFRIGLALFAAVLTGGAALYGVHTRARQATAASYETLAPEINQLKTAVQLLQAENANLWTALQDRHANGNAPQATTEGRSAPRRTRPRAESPPADPRPGERPRAPVEEEPALPRKPEVLEGIEDRVPVDFDKAIEIWRDIERMRKPNR